MIFRKGWGKDGVNESTLDRGMERGRSGIIEWGTHIYGRLAGGHKAVHWYRGENWVVIAFRMREKRRMCRIRLVVKNIRRDGEVKHMLNIKFRGWIRKVGIYRDVRLEGNVWVVKGVRIGRLYREGHGNGGRKRMGKRGRLEEGGVVRVSGRGGRERSREIVGKRPPVFRGRGRGRGGRHLSHREKPLGFGKH
jgi:hypothetical protein